MLAEHSLEFLKSINDPDNVLPFLINVVCVFVFVFSASIIFLWSFIWVVL